MPEWPGVTATLPPSPTPLPADPAANRRRAMRAIALFEAAKGLAAFAALAGLLDLLHHDVRRLAIELIGRFGLNPEARFPSLLLHYADRLPDANVTHVLALGVGYIAIRLGEAYGLWHDHAWGELLGALSGALYVPFEVTHLVHRPSLVGAAVLAGNVFLVVFLTLQLIRRRRKLPAAPRGA